MFIITLNTVINSNPAPMFGSNLEPIKLGSRATYNFQSRRGRYAYKTLGADASISGKFARRHFHRKAKTFRDWN